MNTYTFQTNGGLSINADYYPAGKNEKNVTILYFHGGGLMYGQRQDLPDVYRRMFSNAGYNFLAFDYPLAPESSLADIHSGTEECVRWFWSAFRNENDGELPRYILFGRSAGAYLTLVLARRLISLGLPGPERIISFYGYCRFDEPEFHRPSPFYLRYPLIEQSLLEDAKNASPVTSGPIEKRYSLYVCARQNGDWPLWLAEDEAELMKYSLGEDDLSVLPPAFLTASSSDEDVPFRVSKRMAQRIPGSVFYPVYYLEHDFDRDTGRAEGRQAYEACILWLGDLCKG